MNKTTINGSNVFKLKGRYAGGEPGGDLTNRHYLVQKAWTVTILSTRLNNETKQKTTQTYNHESLDDIIQIKSLQEFITPCVSRANGGPRGQHKAD